ncbi:3'-5' exonuclease [Sulfurospirillum barnesii]|uniref:Exonuclease, DNA polymerase III, epsilon subunit family n=1 Tax=Sulfurospirillum barnesii (strain ATCC 700032 / DSM 10660 / SES-3) TaxID=760154 RepID=I3XYD6_SULBS|nr:3'-5' exonuclease [Sulfurospirillum barnesii]AFL68960.1 exonuclease, DNA polymerase III, epsilon subunit family [Sulfurospirillum barnesii SES-3]
MRPLDNFITKLTQKPIFYKEFFAKMHTFKELEPVDVEDLEMLKLLGLPICKYNNYALTLETLTTPICEGKFCIVDIEANGSKPTVDAIIEIGAVMVEKGKIIGEFSSLAKTDSLPESITQLTGITLDELAFAPSLNSVLEGFRLFIRDAVFVAHNVNFDYYFISYALEQAGFGPLLNRRLDTIDLARKCIEAPKYGLSALAEHLGISFENHHRALFDAKATTEVFLHTLHHLPEEVLTVEQLIAFSRPQQQRKKKKEKQTKPDTSL